MIVSLGMQFGKELVNYPDEDKKKIYAFLLHVKNNGFHGLEGRNKSSDNVHKDDPGYLEKVRLAVQHKLWHYHIGIVEYDYSKPHGDRTSEYVLHYMNECIPQEVKIVDFSSHPPFRPPSAAYLM
ncbi:hypothetical protein [Serratia fonticola]|uniref:hypothetical protein n=1 Tax=Serratia fonticola TaxID=47917 RepID=UPI00093B4034|nr:hypothetical protein [Serratia fonticola]OKP31342.1 hypothetical protein BSQ40_00300 [Serratia fonticola]